MNTVGLRARHFVDQHEYHEMEKDKVQVEHDNDIYISLYSTVEQQIRADAISSRQIYEEEKKEFKKQIKHIGNKRPNEYHLDSIRRQSIPYQNKVVSKIERTH